MNKPKIKIDVVSDVVCPWCYIGKRRLEKAMDQLSGEYDFDIQYLPFELNADMPGEGRDQKEYLSAKFGGAARYTEITNHVTKVAAGEGLEFHFERQHTSPNTRQAHRLIWLAKKDGKQAAVKEALMQAYFSRGIDLSVKENLITVAVDAGLSHDKVVAMLNSAEGEPEVLAAEQFNYQNGVSGVPFYIVNDKYGISGAQPTDVFMQALKEIGNEVLPAASCETDKPC